MRAAGTKRGSGQRWGRRGRGVILLVCLGLLGTFAGRTPSADAVHGAQPGLPPATLNDARPGTENVWQVEVGGGDMLGEYDLDRQYSFMAYYPQKLQVHRGDLVEWRFGGGFSKWHTVSFDPVDIDASTPVAHVNTFLRGDEQPGAIALAESFVLGDADIPGPGRCGMRAPDVTMARPGLGPCEVTADKATRSSMSQHFFDSGQPQGSPFWAYIDLPAGEYRYHCELHPDMKGAIEVLAADEPVPTQAEVHRGAHEEFDRDLAAGEQLYADALASVGSTFDADGVRTWDVLAGVETADQRVGINDYLPAQLNIAPGDRVRFLADGVDPQTVTFPAEAVGSYAPGGCDMHRCEYKFVDQQPDQTQRDIFYGVVPLAFPWLCEYDGATTGLPAVATWVPRVGCAGDGRVEWRVAEILTASQPAPANLVTTGATPHNSGLLFQPSAPASVASLPDGQRLPSTFEAGFPVSGTFRYGCLIHPGGMEGVITVGAS